MKGRYLIVTLDDNDRPVSTDLYVGDWYMANRIADATAARTIVRPDHW